MTTRRLPEAFSLALAGLLALGGSACTAGEVDEAAVPAPAPTVALAADDAPAPPATTQEAEQPPVERAVDAGAVRALAEEVARLRAQLADVTDELEQARASGAPEPTSPLITPLDEAAAAAPAAEAPRNEEPVVELHDVTEDGHDEIEVIEGLPPSEREIVIEREVLVEREPEIVYVDSEPDIVVIQESEPTVIYEQVVYEDRTVYQWVPYGHVHHIGCGHHYYGCSCHPWYYECGGGVSFHVSNSDWYGWVGFGHPYTYYNFGYWKRGYDYDHWHRHRHDWHASHRGHHGPRDGGRKRSKRSYRQGFQDGFESGDDRPAARTPRPSGERGSRGVVGSDQRTRSGSPAGRPVPRATPARPGGEDPSAGRTVTRPRTPTATPERPRSATTPAFRSAAERERVRREAAGRSIGGQRARETETITRSGRSSTPRIEVIRGRNDDDRRRRTRGSAAAPQRSGDAARRTPTTTRSSAPTRSVERSRTPRVERRSAPTPQRVAPDTRRRDRTRTRAPQQRTAPVRRASPPRRSSPTRMSPTRSRRDQRSQRGNRNRSRGKKGQSE